MVVHILGSLCRLCGDPLQEGEDGGLCSSCRDGDVYFDGAASVLQFDGIVQAALHRLKYENDLDAAVPLGRYMAYKLKKLNWHVDIILPVPLHVERLKERGYNQSCLLAREVGRECSIDVMDNLLFRKRYTESQVHLSRNERIANVRGAFDIAGTKEVAESSILVIDDIMTTGATLNECSRLLKKYGARKVYCLTAARPIHLK